MAKKFYLLNSLILTALFASTAFAQGLPTGEKPIIVTVSPKYPKAFEKVVVQVENYSKDLNATDISWSLNGKVVLKGIGQKKFEFETGKLGSASNISINMGGKTESLTIRPTVVDLIWQADSSVPPFYKGKSLHSNQGKLTVVAEPFFITSQGSRLNPANLTYKWRKNNILDNNASGYGKSAYKIPTQVLMKPIDIEVEVSSTDNIFKSSSKITISESPTQTILYESHPLFGIRYETALSDKTFVLSGNDEVSVSAVPFFFSRSNNFSGLKYVWKLNGSAVSYSGQTATFRKPENVSGKSEIVVDVSGIENVFQKSGAKFSLDFSKSDASQTFQIF